MTGKDFREIQVSSSLLVIIFLGVLVLGVFIFLLGVSVGKKQVHLTAQSRAATESQIPEPVKEQPLKTVIPEAGQVESLSRSDAIPSSNPPSTGQPSQGPAGEGKPQPKVQEQPPTKPVAKKSSPPAKAPLSEGTGLYYVQVAAFKDKTQALATAERFRKQGYTAVILDPRPTDKSTWYRVRLGGYAARTRASDLLNKLNAAAGKKTDYVVVRD